MVFDQLEVALEGGVVFEHIQDEAFFDRLAHGVDVEGHRLPSAIFATEQLQGLVLGCGGEGEIGDVVLVDRGCGFPG